MHRWGKDHNTITLVGSDKEYIESLVKEVEEGVKGTRITVEGEDEVEQVETAAVGVVETPATKESKN